MLNSNSESGHPFLVPDFRGNAFNFLPLRVMVTVGLSYIAFAMLRYVASMPVFWRVLIINRCSILSRAFSASIEIIIWFLSFRGRDTGKLSNWPKWSKLLPEIPSSAKDRRGCCGYWFETSKGRKASHMEMEKQILCKQILLGCTEKVGQSRNWFLGPA